MLIDINNAEWSPHYYFWKFNKIRCLNMSWVATYRTHYHFKLWQIEWCSVSEVSFNKKVFRMLALSFFLIVPSLLFQHTRVFLNILSRNRSIVTSELLPLCQKSKTWIFSPTGLRLGFFFFLELFQTINDSSGSLT